ncbi:uncharacterized protein BDZ99DRAFT_514177 [Mytilinidion resinicola]|uniref:Uncharacterized protein n=1 Tax=Mytilinidion resinicola TaxID=574789 RepID=A0A6A6ZAB6_9PEZI|nr:uncharacterized protein BDZ99DRAFT_514177 [Mytilinidion resinicola]KAF2817956.1 hypothetical protein BDZ99DRAFT_514177 [Mytilinidion resinicola]
MPATLSDAHQGYLLFSELPNELKEELMNVVRVPSIFLVDSIMHKDDESLPPKYQLTGTYWPFAHMSVFTHKVPVDINDILQRYRGKDDKSIFYNEMIIFLEAFYRANIFVFPTDIEAYILANIDPQSYNWIQDIAVTSLAKAYERNGFYDMCSVLAKTHARSLRRVRIEQLCVEEYVLDRIDMDTDEDPATVAHQFAVGLKGFVDMVVLRAAKLIAATRQHGWRLSVEWDYDGEKPIVFCHDRYSTSEADRLRNQALLQERIEQVGRLLDGRDVQNLTLKQIKAIITKDMTLIQELDKDELSRYD